MAKPSIFSKNYEKKMKKRKIIIISSILIGIFFVFMLGIYIKNILVEEAKSNYNDAKKYSKNTSIVKNKNEDEIKDKKEKDKKENEKVSKNEYNISLSDEIKIKAIYENKGNSKEFKSVLTEKSNIDYSINKSKQGIIIYDNNEQDIFYVNIDGKAENLTKKQYVSTNGTTFNKDEKLKDNPEYVWCSSPKFIDDENIAYLSNLPWFNKAEKYVWIVNIKNKEHKWIENLFGDNIKLEETTDKGLSVLIDERKLFLKNDGSVIE